MGKKLFGGGSVNPDKELRRQREQQEAKAAAEAEALKAQQEEEERRRRAGLVGSRQLQSAGDLGFPRMLGPALGSGVKTGRLLSLGG